MYIELLLTCSNDPNWGHTPSSMCEGFSHRYMISTWHAWILLIQSGAVLSLSLFLMSNTLVCFYSSEAFPGGYTWQDQAAKGSHSYLDWCALECKSLHTTQEHDYRRTFSQTTQLHVLMCIATFDFCGLLVDWFQTEVIQLQVYMQASPISFTYFTAHRYITLLYAQFLLTQAAVQDWYHPCSWWATLWFAIILISISLKIHTETSCQRKANNAWSDVHLNVSCHTPGSLLGNMIIEGQAHKKTQLHVHWIATSCFLLQRSQKPSSGCAMRAHKFSPTSLLTDT